MNTTTAGRVDYRRPGRPTSAHTIKVSGVMGEPQSTNWRVLFYLSYIWLYHHIRRREEWLDDLTAR